MAAPTTARSAPVGLFLEDGFSTLVAFQADPDVSFWEKTVKPVGIDGGAPIETTTMHNTAWRSMKPRQLKTATDVTSKVAYDPVVYDQIIALINVETGITVHFSNGDVLNFYGFLRTFEPADCAEGAQPEANITITATNLDPSTNAEVAPDYIASGGT